MRARRDSSVCQVGARGGPRSTYAFFLCTLATTWLAWSPAALAGAEPHLLLFALGGIAPSLWGIALTHLEGNRQERRDFWRRVLDPRRIPVRWLLVIVLLNPLVMATSIALGVAGGAEPPSFEFLSDMLSQPRQLAQLLLVLLVGGPLAEELGWRGYALDRLQSRLSAFASSLILGVVAVLWHLPLFFMPGTAQGEMGFATLPFLAWVGSTFAGNILLTWVYNNSRRSTLSAILLHFMGNLTFTIAAGLGHALPGPFAVIDALLQMLVAVAVVSVWGPARMSRRQAHGAPSRGTR